MGLRFENVTTTMMFVVYIMVNKIVVSPMVIMTLYYGISGEIPQPLFMIAFSFYVTNPKVKLMSVGMHKG